MTAEPLEATSDDVLLSQLRAVHRLTLALHAADSGAAFYEEAVEAVVTEVGADRAALLLFDADDVMRFKAWRGLSAGYRQAVEGHSPWAPGDAGAQPILVPDVADDPALVGLLPVLAAEGVAALAFVPLVHDGRLAGKFMLYYDKPHDFGAVELALAEILAAHVALALDRRRADEELRRQNERVAGLQRVTAEFSRAVTVDDVARVVLSSAVAELGGHSGSLCLLVEGGQLEIVAAVGYPSDVMKSWGRFPLDAELPASEAVRTGEPVFIGSPEERDERYPVFAASPVVPDLAHAMVPLSHQRRLGCFVVGFPHRRLFSADDRAFLSNLADQCGAALVRARLYEQRTRLAQTLQASLLPPSLPEVPGLELAARYVAGSAGVEVGGDFYDVFAVDGGRFVAVLGDVCGRGVEAATLGTLVRYTIRSAALGRPSPAAIVSHVNEVLLRNEDAGRHEPRFCTAVVAVIEPDGDGFSATVAVAGHPLPLVRRADGTVDTVGRPGLLIGIDAGAEVTETTIRLGAGDALVCFTDGITERRDGRRFFGEDGLARLLAAGDGDARSLAAAIEDAVVSFAAAPAHDDLAVLVLRAAGR